MAASARELSCSCRAGENPESCHQQSDPEQVCPRRAQRSALACRAPKLLEKRVIVDEFNGMFGAPGGGPDKAGLPGAEALIATAR